MLKLKKLKYDAITHSNLKTNDKNTTLELKFANGQTINLDSLKITTVRKTGYLRDK